MRPYSVKFPEDTVEILDTLGEKHSLTRELVIAKSIGFFVAWDEAQEAKKVWVEQLKSGGDEGIEIVI